MATERLTMQKLREILRHKLELGRSHRQVARALGISAGSVAGAATRVKALGLDWAAVCALDDEALETRLYGPRGGRRDGRPMPELGRVHLELRRPGVTLSLLHLEYLEQHPDGYRYTVFCELYREWRKCRSVTMRQVHIAGDKLFEDYSGKKPCIVDPATGEVREVELYVAVLGASSYTFAEATLTQRLPDFIASNVRGLEFFGGVPAAMVPDQLKSAVTNACIYDPEIQRTFDELGSHFGTTIMPARPRKPRDKAKVEVAVQVAQRWILARLRNQTFFSLGELNDRIRELLIELNSRTMRGYGKSRREMFEEFERAALRPLPAEPFEFAEWKKGRLNVDYHMEFDGHYYSAPHTLHRQELWLRATASTVEIFHAGRRVSCHARSHARAKHTTITAHMPAAHQKQVEWTPSRILGWAETVGPNTRLLAEAILKERRHPEQGYRSCLGIYRLAKRYGNERTDAACARVLTAGGRSYRHVRSVLLHGLDRAPALDIGPRGPGIAHENVRGRGYYH
jgi:transposase